MRIRDLGPGIETIVKKQPFNKNDLGNWTKSSQNSLKVLLIKR